jgi:hypothetical protein
MQLVIPRPKQLSLYEVSERVSDCYVIRMYYVCFGRMFVTETEEVS